MHCRRLLLAALILFAAGQPLAAQENFYRGKTIRIVVGFSAGGGFDTYARVLARHMTKHIPGTPAIIVENMTGAGSLIAANHVYNVAKPDGLTIGHFIGGLFLGQVLGQKGVQLDARRFEFIGAPVRDQSVCALTKASGITFVERWFAASTPVKTRLCRGGFIDAEQRHARAQSGTGPADSSRHRLQGNG